MWCCLVTDSSNCTWGATQVHILRSSLAGELRPGSPLRLRLWDLPRVWVCPARVSALAADIRSCHPTIGGIDAFNARAHVACPLLQDLRLRPPRDAESLPGVWDRRSDGRDMLNRHI